MNQILARIWLSFWHLLPANPILVRVVGGASRQRKHLIYRAVYLLAICAVVFFSIVTIQGSRGLNELAKEASQTFKLASYTQLALMCFLAPMFTAGAITQERDAQTYNILLSTPLSNAQIVLGSLISRLYFVFSLLLAGLPIFCLTMVYGGVTSSQIFESFALAGCTAAVTGSVAIFISIAGVGTRRTIFSFYLVIAIYLLAIYLLGNWSPTWLDAAPANVNGRKMSVLSALHPFLALEVSLNIVRAPDVPLVAGRPAILRHALAFPSATYVVWTAATSLVLTGMAMFFVRHGAKTGEPTFVSQFLDRFRRQASGERTRTPHVVWKNPVAWREAVTKSAQGAGGLMRWSVIIAGAAASVGLFLYHLTDPAGMPPTIVKQWLGGIIMIQFAIAMLIATNTAAVSMTKERESKTIDVLLCTPLTSTYIVFGKLRGLVSFAAPLVAVPVASLLLFGVYSLLPGKSQGMIWVETAVELAAVMVLTLAVVCILSLKVSLTSRQTVRAVVKSLAIVILGTGCLTLVTTTITQQAGQAGTFFAPFSPFSGIRYLLYPDTLSTSFARQAASMRFLGFVGSAVATGVYLIIAFSMYKSLVTNFDMTMRKQTGT
ncbi:MAG: hypothetical protein C4547_00610 [Phycisphaerales bacterium]|nr:MAG: hypothetical protein C4547_00610 [Phycisphaerales bacterium]